MKMPEPIFEFNIYPNSLKKDFYYKVYIWNAHKDFVKALRAQGSQEASKGNPGAVCANYRKIKYVNGRLITSREIGALHFKRKKLWTEILVHECTHAALNYLRVKGIDVSDASSKNNVFTLDSGEESLCYAAGQLVSQLINKLWKKSLVK